MPAKKRRYTKPELKVRAKPAKKQPDYVLWRNARIVMLENSLETYFGMVKLIKEERGERAPDMERVRELEKGRETTKRGILESLVDVIENYPLSRPQMGVIEQMLKSLDNPTERNIHETMSNTCMLKTEE